MIILAANNALVPVCQCSKWNYKQHPRLRKQIQNVGGVVGTNRHNDSGEYMGPGQGIALGVGGKVCQNPMQFKCFDGAF